jgi:hypothetical protein
MWQDDQIDALIVLVAGLDRAAVSQHIQAYPARFPIDFTDEYLDRQPTERLKHLLVAMCLTHKQMPRELTPVMASAMA